ncbi:hypothetical protein GCM10027422_34050 [Hymenobacter arcticus]
MKARQLLALACSSVLATSTGCTKDGDVSPESAFTTGQLVKLETTLDGTGQNPRSRWIIDLAPITLEGYQAKLYSQVKVFNLPANLDYQAGQRISFHYQLVPYAQQTPWKTTYEWLAVPAMPPGATALPEISVTDAH